MVCFLFNFHVDYLTNCGHIDDQLVTFMRRTDYFTKTVNWYMSAFPLSDLKVHVGGWKHDDNSPLTQSLFRNTAASKTREILVFKFPLPTKELVAVLWDEGVFKRKYCVSRIQR